MLFYETICPLDPLISWTGGAEVSEAATEMQRAPGCREHQILHGRLRADTKVYVDASRRLESCQSTDFEKTYEAAESARIAFLKAREALNAHIATQKCAR